MPGEVLSIEVDGLATEVSLRFLAEYTGPSSSDSVLVFLQRVRIPSLTKAYPEQMEHLEREYTKHLPLLTDQFRRLIQDLDPDLIAAAPTSRPNLLDPYFTVIREAFPNALDVSARFAKRHHAAATTAKTFGEVYDATLYSGPALPAGIRTVLLVDDVFAKGATVTAVIRRLREAGLDHNISTTLACPLRINVPGRQGAAKYQLPDDFF
jgi:hypothetical protein